MSSSITWREFRERYYRLHVCNMRSRIDCESRLNVIERILNPKNLADVCNTETLERLRNLLLEGVEGRPLPGETTGHVRPRSPHTVRTTMAVLIGALRWAEYTGMIERAPKLRRIKVANLKHMKGRPLTEKEMESMLNAAEAIVPRRNLKHWRYILRGLWCSGLRLSELLNVHWDDATFITPCWREWTLPVLRIPAAMQKNDTEESIPLLPEFEALLLEVPADERRGWVFNPFGGRRGIGVNGKRRMTCERVSRIISKIGRHAGIVVSESRSGSRAKYASAHDLRRSCADRLIAAGIPERDVARIMRHASIETTRRYYAPGDVQRSARLIRDCYAKPATSLVDRLDRKWLVQAIKEVESDKRIVANSSWVARVDAVKQKFKEIVGDDGAFPWSDSVIIDLWGTLT